MAWNTLGAPPKLPKGVAQALAGGPQPIRRTAFGGGTTRSTADISFEPQSAIDERVRLRAQFGRRADHLIVGQDDDSTRRSSSGSGAPPPQPTKPRRQLGDRVSPPSRRRGPAEKRTIGQLALPKLEALSRMWEKMTTSLQQTVGSAGTLGTLATNDANMCEWSPHLSA